MRPLGLLAVFLAVLGSAKKILLTRDEILDEFTENRHDLKRMNTVFKENFAVVKKDALLLYCYADILERSDNRDKATKMLKRCVRLPRSEVTPACLEILCDYEVMKQRSGKDFGPCDELIEMNGNDAHSMYLYGVSKKLRHDFPAALRYLNMSFAMEDKSETLVHLCFSLADNGRCEEAMQCANKLVERMDVDQTNKFYSAGLTYVVCKRFSEQSRDFYLAAQQEQAKITKGFGCPQMTFSSSFDRAAEREIVYDAGGKVYGLAFPEFYPPQTVEHNTSLSLMFAEKTVKVLEFNDVILQGKAGSIIKDCTLFGGTHKIVSQWLFDTVGEKPGVKMGSINDPVASVVESTHGNYYHVVFEMLGKLSVLRELPETRSLNLIVPSDSSIFMEAFELLGLKNGFVKFDPSMAYKCKKLYYVDWRVDEELPTDTWDVYFPPPSVLRLIRKNFMTNPMLHVRDVRNWKVVFISREGAETRTIKPDESGITNALEKMLGKEHFEVVHGSDLTLSQQIATFSNAVVVIGPHGAGFTNILWMPLGATVILYPMRPECDVCFAHASVAIGMRYVEVPALQTSYYQNYTLIGSEGIDHSVGAVRQALIEMNFWKDEL